MDTETIDSPQNSKDAPQEAVYLVDRAVLLHLKEVQDGDFEYAVFDKLTKGKVSEGRIYEDDVLDGIDPTHDHLAAAREAAIEDAGLDGIEVAQVGLTSLKAFPRSDVYRRSIREPETLPKNDLRFINSSYDEQFRIPDGGTIHVKYPDRAFSVKCKYIDDYHAYIGSEVYHMCQFAEVLERGGGVCRPEPLLEAEQAAWKIGWRASLAVECGGGNWNYHLFDDKMEEVKNGELEVVGFSINEVRDMILAENKMESRSMTPTDYGLLMEKAAQVEQERFCQSREELDVVELFGTTALFFNERVSQNHVPEGLYRYDLRGSDDDPGFPASVEHYVRVNHAGTILAAKPLEIPAQGHLPLDDELNFTGETMTISEFRDKYARPEQVKPHQEHKRVNDQASQTARKSSIRGQLAAAKAAQAEKPAAQQPSKNKEAR